MKRQTGSKLGKEYVKAVYCHLIYLNYMKIQFVRSVVSNSLWPHELQHTRLPCPSPTPIAYSNSCLLSRWCHPTISSSVIPFFSCLQSSPASGSLPDESALRIRWSKYWSFSFSTSHFNEYSGLTSFRRDWLDFLGVLGTLKSLLHWISSNEMDETGAHYTEWSKPER